MPKSEEPSRDRKFTPFLHLHRRPIKGIAAPPTEEFGVFRETLDALRRGIEEQPVAKQPERPTLLGKLQNLFTYKKPDNNGKP